MKKIFLIFCLIVIFSGCSQFKQQMSSQSNDQINKIEENLINVGITSIQQILDILGEEFILQDYTTREYNNVVRRITFRKNISNTCTNVITEFGNDQILRRIEYIMLEEDLCNAKTRNKN